MRIFIVFPNATEDMHVNRLPNLFVQPILQCDLKLEPFLFVCSSEAWAKPPVYDDLLSKELLKFQPDIVIYSPFHYPPYRFFEAAQKANIPVMTLFWDTRKELGKFELDLFLNTNIAVVGDSLATFYRFKQLNSFMQRSPLEFNTTFCGGMIFLPEDFPHQKMEKQYDVLLLGSLEGGRIDLLARLKNELAKRKIRFTKLGGITASPKDKNICHNDYLAAINQAKILITSQTQSARLQIKNKVFEFLSCGGFVLVDRNLEYESILPEECVAYYSDFEDLVTKIEYYHHHPKEASIIAECGHAWFHATFKPRQFWADLLTAVHERREVMPISPLLSEKNPASNHVEVEMKDKMRAGINITPYLRYQCYQRYRYLHYLHYYLRHLRCLYPKKIAFLLLSLFGHNTDYGNNVRQEYKQLLGAIGSRLKRLYSWQ